MSQDEPEVAVAAAPPRCSLAGLVAHGSHGGDGCRGQLGQQQAPGDGGRGGVDEGLQLVHQPKNDINFGLVLWNAF